MVRTARHHRLITHPEKAAAIRLHRPGQGGRRPAIAEWLAGIGVRVEPGPPAAGTEARDRWEEARKAELHRQLDRVRERTRGHC